MTAGQAPFIISQPEEEQRRGRRPTRDTFPEPDFDGGRQKKETEKKAKRNKTQMWSGAPSEAARRRSSAPLAEPLSASSTQSSVSILPVRIHLFGSVLTESDAVSQRTLTNQQSCEGGRRRFWGCGGGSSAHHVCRKGKKSGGSDSTWY